MLDRATHRSILQEEHCFLGRRSSPADSSRPHWPEGTCAVCSTCAATVFRKKYPHASLRHSCGRFSRDVRSIFCLGGEPSQKTRKVKAIAGQLVTITVGFSIDDRFAITSTDRHQLGTCHLLNFFHAIFPPWQLALTVFMQEVPTPHRAATCTCDKQTACVLGLCAARHLSLSVSCDSSSRSISNSNWHTDVLP